MVVTVNKQRLNFDLFHLFSSSCDPSVDDDLVSHDPGLGFSLAAFWVSVNSTRRERKWKQKKPDGTFQQGRVSVRRRPEPPPPTTMFALFVASAILCQRRSGSEMVATLYGQRPRPAQEFRRKKKSCFYRTLWCLRHVAGQLTNHRPGNDQIKTNEREFPQFKHLHLSSFKTREEREED